MPMRLKEITPNSTSTAFSIHARTWRLTESSGRVISRQRLGGGIGSLAPWRQRRFFAASLAPVPVAPAVPWASSSPLRPAWPLLDRHRGAVGEEAGAVQRDGFAAGEAFEDLDAAAALGAGLDRLSAAPSSGHRRRR
jgi:hypothetical protein